MTIGGAILFVAGVITAVILWLRPPRPFHLVVIGAGYETNLAVPHNIPGRRGAEAVEEWGRGYSRPWQMEPKEVPCLVTSNPAERIRQELDFSAKIVVVYVSAHGVVRLRNGIPVPYLVADNDNLADPKSLWPLEDVLKELKDLPGKKLLILDCTTAAAHEPLGELHHDWVSCLKSTLDRIGVPRLVVLSSSSSYERSWASPEWGQTVFAHYVLEGLKGKADLEGKDKKGSNGRVDAWELYQYVQRHVSRWARANRERPQTPVLLTDNEQEARDIELVAYRGNPEVTEEEKTDPAGNDTLCKAGWEERDRLEEATPHPAVYTPHLWRRYLDTLLRAEQLLRWGRPSEEMWVLAGELAEKIKRSAALPQDALSLTLPLPRALGLTAIPNDQLTAWRAEARRELDNAKTSPYDLATKRLKEVAAGALKPYQRESLLRAQTSGEVVRSLAEDLDKEAQKGALGRPEKVWSEGLRLVEALDAPEPYCRPAEVHYLRMLNTPRGKTDAAPIAALLQEKRWDLLSLALRVRLQAEKATLGLGDAEQEKDLPPYSEQVQAWIRPRVEQGDRLRRQGQDLLFTAETKSWTEAAEQLRQAQKCYLEASTISIEVRRALHERDRALAALPYYTRWVEEQAPEQAPEHLQEAIKAWGAVHELSKELKPGADGVAQLKRLRALREKVESGLKSLRSGVENAIGLSLGPRDATRRSQNRWHEIEAALEDPFLQWDKRAKLLQESREISGDLLERFDPDNPAVLHPDPDHARTAALRHQRLALAALGLSDKDELGQTHWDKGVYEAGEGVGKRRNRMPEDAQNKVAEASRQPLEEARKLLAEAAHLARTVDGAAVGERLTDDPVKEQRRLLLHDLFVWQADRSYLDYWADLKPGKPFYFQTAGNIFLDEAKKLVKGSQQLLVNEEEKKINAARGIVAEWSLSGDPNSFSTEAKAYYSTDEGSQTRFYRLRCDDREGKLGIPVKWVEVSAGLQVPSGAQGKPNKAGFDTPIPVTIAPLGRSGGEMTHRFRGYFRGHWAEVATRVTLSAGPSLVRSLPPPPRDGWVGIYSRKGVYEQIGADQAAIAFVLDYSVSMRQRVRGETRPKFKQAREALARVVRNLPNGVQVSLRVFHEPPTRDDLGIRLLWTPHRWKANDEDIKSRMDQLDLTPDAGTPLLDAMTEARQELLKSRAKVRNMVVITDGGDSAKFIYEDNRKQKLRDFIRETFGDDRSYQITVIGYGIDPTSSKLEKEAADVLADELPPLGHEYIPAASGEELLAELNRRLFYTYYRIDVERDPQDWPRGDWTISEPDRNPRWVHLEHPGRFTVTLPAIRFDNRPVQQDVEVRPGEALLLELVHGSRGPEFRRALFSEWPSLARTHGTRILPKSVKDWHLAVLQNQGHRPMGLTVMATLEKKEASSKATIRHIHPDWAWFEVSTSATGSPARGTLRLMPLSYYPAPAWEIDLPQWPQGAPASLEAWWSETPQEPFRRLTKRDDFPSGLRALDSRPLDGARGEVILNSVRQETRKVLVKPGERRRDRSCVVVRLSYPSGQQPYFVRIPSWHLAPGYGQEHSFYVESGINKYTGVFWVEGDPETVALDELEVFSVAELKKQALHVDRFDLGDPDNHHRYPDVSQGP